MSNEALLVCSQEISSLVRAGDVEALRELLSSNVLLDLGGQEAQTLGYRELFKMEQDILFHWLKIAIEHPVTRDWATEVFKLGGMAEASNFSQETEEKIRVYARMLGEASVYGYSPPFKGAKMVVVLRGLLHRLAIDSEIDSESIKAIS